MSPATLNQVLLDALRRLARPDLLLHKRQGQWRPISTDSFLRQAASLAQALAAQGVGKGDRVALFSENRPEWHIADLAVLGLGAINVPIYLAESGERLAYILQHSAARLCFTSGEEQYEKVCALWPELPALETVIPFARSASATARGKILAWEELARVEAGDDVVAAFERRAREAKPSDVASLIYTSGTTGTPKGALLTQGNFASNVATTAQLFAYRPEDLALSLLPLCHIFERTTDYSYLARGVSLAYAEGFDKVVANMQEVRPTIMAVVPRFFEKFYARLQEAEQAAPAWKRRLLRWAHGVGKEALPYRLAQEALPGWLGVRYRLAEALVYRKLRVRLGGRMRAFISGGAPLSRGLNEFFHCLGLTIYEGYGLTETSPVIAVSLPGAVRLGTVGRPIPEVEVKIASDGEILTRGPHVMKGYYKDEESTRAALRQGWFHTGDIGFLDDDGFLTVTDRKKELLKTAGGKYVAPQPIENRLKQSPYIQSAVVVGDRRKFAAALLVPNFASLEVYAREQGVQFSSRAELLAQPVVRAAVAAEVEKVNRDLPQYEKLKRFALLEEDFSFDGGQLTYTQKVKRKNIEEQYRAVIDELYEESAAPPGADCAS